MQNASVSGEKKDRRLPERDEEAPALRQVDQSCAVLAHVAPGPRAVSSVGVCGRELVPGL